MGLNASDLLEYMRKDLGIDTSDVEESTPLFTSGIIDSFALVALVTFIERCCGFVVQPTDVTLENMDSVQRILAFADRARA